MSEPTVAWRPIEMLAEKDAEITRLKGLLREAESHLINSPYINAQNVGAKIRKALEIEK